MLKKYQINPLQFQSYFKHFERQNKKKKSLKKQTGAYTQAYLLPSPTFEQR